MPKPKIVCLCGSTRFYKEFVEQNYIETMKGNIVLSVGFFAHTTPEAHGQEIGISAEQKTMLDHLHLRKIDLADEVLFINVGGYIGESTSKELQHSMDKHKKIRFLEPVEEKEENIVLPQNDKNPITRMLAEHAIMAERLRECEEIWIDSDNVIRWNGSGNPIWRE